MVSKALGRVAGRSMGGWLKKHSSGLLITGAISTAVAASVAAAIGGYKSRPKIEAVKASEEYKSMDSKFKKAWALTKAAAPYYIAPVTLVGGSVVCSVSHYKVTATKIEALKINSKILSKNAERFMHECAAELGEEKIREIRQRSTVREADSKVVDEMSKKTVDKETSTAIPPEDVDGSQLFYDEVTDQYFYSNIEILRKAEHRIDDMLLSQDWVPYNEFIALAGGKRTRGIRSAGLTYGWNMGQRVDFDWGCGCSKTSMKIFYTVLTSVTDPENASPTRKSTWDYS